MTDDDVVARLVREERLAAAASLASARGDPKTASELFERACEWPRAAHEALLAGDPGRALRLAVLAGDEPLAERALRGAAAHPDTCAHLAAQLDRQGAPAWAARAYEAAGRGVDAARAWERAGDAVRAAELLEAERDVVGAARVLEAAIRRTPGAWSTHVALGNLLVRYGKDEAAVRVLQAIPDAADERPRALAPLIAALERLGLGQALHEARSELARSALPPDAPAALPASAPDAAVDASPEGARARIYGRYAIVREVASTASARVVECLDVVRGGAVAVKLFAGHAIGGAGRDVLARFEREVKILGAIDHPNVVKLQDYFPEGPALVLEWMPGGTLERMLASGPLAPARAVEIACAVLSALGEAHRVGVLHRDVKPSNVLFDAAGGAKLSDFGVAHLGDLSITATAGLIGTLAYMSPEQREGHPATVASDVYGAGALLFEMLTGEPPPKDGAVTFHPSGAHRDLGPAHDEVVSSLLARDPGARPGDTFAARRALTALAWPVTVDPMGTRPSTRRAPSDRPQPSGRLGRDAAGCDVDTWLHRAIERLPLTEANLRRAGAFARAGHPALQTVLRVDRDADELWLEAPRGEALARPLEAGEIAPLRAALDALHRAGAVHGAVDRRHVFVGPDEGVTLTFPRREASALATADLDRIALARLGDALDDAS